MAMLFGRAPSTSAAKTTPSELSRDVELANGPGDSISDLCWSPVSSHLAVASWDQKVRIYEVNSVGSGEGRAFIDFDGAVLNCHWSKDGQRVVGAGTDKTARVLDLGVAGAPSQQVALHDEPIRSTRFVSIPTSHSPILATGSWDRTVKFWDLRQPTPLASLLCQDRVYSMDTKENLLVIGTAERHVHIVNLNTPTAFHKTVQSPLKQQTRVVTCINDASGFAVGSTEGRCAFQYLDEKDASRNFSFRCHRDPPVNNEVNVYSVNAISFHPVYGTFSTAGSDGTFHFWDKDAHHRLKGYPSVGGAISTTSFNKEGTFFAYGVSYDWSKGFQHNTTQYMNKIMLHPVTADECKPRQVVKKR